MKIPKFKQINWQVVYSAVFTIISFVLAQHIFPQYTTYFTIAASLLTLLHTLPLPENSAQIVVDFVKVVQTVYPELPPKTQALLAPYLKAVEVLVSTAPAPAPAPAPK